MAVKDFFNITAGNQEGKAGAGEIPVVQKATVKTPEADIVQLIRNSPTSVLICILSGETYFDKQLEVKLRQLQSDYKDNIRIGKVDSGIFEIDDLPTLILFPAGRSKPDSSGRMRSPARRSIGCCESQGLPSSCQKSAARIFTSGYSSSGNQTGPTSPAKMTVTNTGSGYYSPKATAGGNRCWIVRIGRPTIPKG
jgi:hypothetical protein